jgi:hypothetical protein
MTIVRNNSGSPETAWVDGSSTDENRLNLLLKLAKVSTKMVATLQKGAPGFGADWDLGVFCQGRTGRIHLRRQQSRQVARRHRCPA